MTTFTYTPDNAAQVKTRPRVREAKFGDGYSQRTGDGINIRMREWNLTFNSRTDAEISPIITFLEGENGITAFDWVPPVGSTGKWICKEWSHTKVRYGINNLSATFMEVPG